MILRRREQEGQQQTRHGQWRRGEGVEPSGKRNTRQAGFEDRWGHRAPSSSGWCAKRGERWPRARRRIIAAQRREGASPLRPCSLRRRSEIVNFSEVLVVQQAVEKGIFNSLLPLSRLPHRGRRLGRQPTFTQGVEHACASAAPFSGFLNILLGRVRVASKRADGARATMRIEPQALGHKGFGTLTRAACGGLSSPAYDAGEGARKRLARFLHKLSGQAT